MLARSLDRISPAALDQHDVIDARGHLQDVFQGAVQLVHSHLARIVALAQTIRMQLVVHTRVYRELVVVDLRAHRIQVHGLIAEGDLNGVHRLDGGRLLAPEQVLSQRIDRRSLSTLRNPDSQGSLVDVQHITALDMGLAMVVVPERRSRKIGMIGKEGLIEGHLAIALIVVHAMQRHSRADGGNGIAGEIARRHREHHEVVECEAVSLQTGRRERAGRQIKLVHTHAGKRLVHQLAIVLNSIELLANKGHQCRIGNGSLDHIFIQKRRARRLVHLLLLHLTRQHQPLRRHPQKCKTGEKHKVLAGFSRHQRCNLPRNLRARR